MSSVMPDPETTRSPLSSRVYEHIIVELDAVDDDFQRESILDSQNAIARFERSFGMTSSEMRRKVASGEIEETYDICRWSQEISLLDHLFTRQG